MTRVRRVCSATGRPCYRLRSWSSNWRSFADLERFARDKDDPHLEPWRKFNRTVGGSGDVGIWHETYRVPTANIETIYGNMPLGGPGAAVGLVPVGLGRETAVARLGVRDDDESVVPVT